MFDFLKSKKEILPMQWTTELPKESGIYLCRYSTLEEYIVKRIYEHNGQLIFIEFSEICPITYFKPKFSHFMKIEDPA